MKNILKLIGIIALVAVIAFSMAACSDDDGDSGGYWLISKQTTYTFTEGASGSGETYYNWIAYHYSNENDYEEEYNVSSTNGSSAYYHYTRKGQTSESTNQTDAGTSSTTTVYDAGSGLTLKQTSNSSGNTYVISYNITPLGDSGGVKTYRQSVTSYTNNGTPIDNNLLGYAEYKIQNGKTIEASYYDANSVLSYIIKYIQPDSKAIRDKLPRFTLYRYDYSSSANNSYQTAEVLSDSDSALLIRVKTFSNNVLSSQYDSLYEKIKPNGSGGGYKPGNNGGNGGNSDDSNGVLKSNSDFHYREYSNSIEITKYKGAGGNVTIPAQINGKPVTSIGGWAFSGCTSLTSITIPNSVTSIGEYAFYESGLTSVTIPNSVTSIGSAAFADCPLTAINVDTANTAYSSQDGVLYNKAKTTLIQYPKGKTSVSFTIPNSVTSIGVGAFWNCTSLTSVTIPNSVTSIGLQAFSGCTSLASVTIPNSVTSIGNQAFSGCTSLASVTIPNSVTIIDNYAFSGCTSLTSVTIPNSVTSIGKEAFRVCTSLTSVTIGNSVNSIGEGAFAWCSSLTSVTFQGTITAENFNAGTGGYQTFPDDLRDKYLAGGIGTYTRSGTYPSYTWTKQP